MNFMHCSSIENIIWNEYEMSPDQSVRSSDIHIWRVYISANLHLINHFENIVSLDEHVRAGRFHQEKDQQRFLISRITLRKLLADHSDRSPEQIQFYEGLNKKPFVELNNLHFNISHSDDMILIAVANEEVGIDVEKIDADFSYKEILPQNFSDEEINFIKKPEDFYLLWTRKEALLKATAKGIDDDLPRVPSLDGNYNFNDGKLGLNKNWVVKSFQVAKDYVGSVSFSSSNCSLNFYDMIF